MANISSDAVKKIALVSRLEISEEEVAHFTEELEAMVTLAETLDELDTTGVEPMTHVFNQVNVMRDDTSQEGLQIEDVLKNAPDYEGRQIKVPTILE